MSELKDAAMRFRRQLLEKDADVADSLIAYYKSSYSRIETAQKALIQQIREREQSGKEVSRAWLQRQERYKELLRQIEETVSQFATFAREQVRLGVLSAVEQGQNDAQQLAFTALDRETDVPTVLATWNRLPVETLNELAGVLSPDSPVSKLLDSLGATTAQVAKSTLFAGIAAGVNPKVVARQLRRTAGYSVVRARTIARTEMLRAYRQATLETYRENDDIVSGWIWVAALSIRTCAACLALHGKQFPLEEDFGTHPNCRCTQIPITGEGQDIERGEDWFARQPESVQLAVLGKAKLEAYQSGQITLQDLIHEEDSKIWGKTRSEASLKEALSTKT